MQLHIVSTPGLLAYVSASISAHNDIGSAHIMCNQWTHLQRDPCLCEACALNCWLKWLPTSLIKWLLCLSCLFQGLAKKRTMVFWKLPHLSKKWNVPRPGWSMLWRYAWIYIFIYIYAWSPSNHKILPFTCTNVCARGSLCWPMNVQWGVGQWVKPSHPFKFGLLGSLMWQSHRTVAPWCRRSSPSWSVAWRSRSVAWWTNVFGGHPIGSIVCFAKRLCFF